jgi:creatinine amidohydrolase/Fe(II)-dependent formamide hydrolase-like protein
LNGHGGNAAIVAAMRNKLMAEKGITVLGYTYWELPGVEEEMKRVSETDKGFIGHASEMETSMQLHLQPDLVDMGVSRWVPGVWGNPETANPEKGEHVITAAVQGLVKILNGVHNGQLQERMKWRKEVL